MRPDDLIHFCAPSRLILGCGARAQLPRLVQKLGWKHGVLVTDRYFSGSTPWVREYVDAAQALGIDTVVYDGGEPDPTTDLCDAATRSLRQACAGIAVDHVIALGGGSNIDLAKALCLTLPAGLPVREFVGGIGTMQPLPLIAMPTTAGTGSEATPGAILLDPHNATKVAVMDNALRPQVALIDPELTYTCPPRVTADAGIDAFTHAIESFLTIDSCAYDRGGDPDPGYSGRSALTMLFARESMRLCIAFLERAFNDGADREARTGMAHASVYAALSYGSAGLNAVHGIAYAVAGKTHRSHGTTNAVMLPYVLDALGDVRGEELLEVARLMSLEASSAREASLAVPVAVRALIGRLGIPTDLAAIGIEDGDLSGLVDDALGVARLAKAFPVPDAAARYRAIVRNAFAGYLRAEGAGARDF
jgi:alcohol dehydrogenase